jgi:hypothetical protein
MGFPYETQEEFAKIRHCFSLLAHTFTDSFTECFTDSRTVNNSGI